MLNSLNLLNCSATNICQCLIQVAKSTGILNINIGTQFIPVFVKKEDHWSFLQMELNFHWIHWIQEYKDQYKDLLSYNCLCGTVVESLSLTQEILGSNPAIFLFDLNFLSLNSANSVKAFRENSNISKSSTNLTNQKTKKLVCSFLLSGSQIDSLRIMNTLMLRADVDS